MSEETRLLFRKLSALRLEVAREIVDDILTTAKKVITESEKSSQRLADAERCLGEMAETIRSISKKLSHPKAYLEHYTAYKDKYPTEVGDAEVQKEACSD